MCIQPHDEYFEDNSLKRLNLNEKSISKKKIIQEF